MKYVSFLFLLILLASCGQMEPVKEPIPPKDLIPRDTLISLIMELEILEAAVNKGYMSKFRRNDDISKHLTNIYTAYNISPERFDSTMSYYGKKPKEMEILMASVLDRINRFSAEEKKKEEKLNSKK